AFQLRVMSKLPNESAEMVAPSLGLSSEGADGVVSLIVFGKSVSWLTKSSLCPPPNTVWKAPGVVGTSEVVVSPATTTVLAPSVTTSNTPWKDVPGNRVAYGSWRPSGLSSATKNGESESPLSNRS